MDRSVYASQRLGLSRSGGLDVTLDVPIGEVDRTAIRTKEGSLTYRVQNLRLRRHRIYRTEPYDEQRS